MTFVDHKEIKQAKTVGTKLTPREYEEVADSNKQWIIFKCIRFFKGIYKG